MGQNSIRQVMIQGVGTRHIILPGAITVVSFLNNNICTVTAKVLAGVNFFYLSQFKAIGLIKVFPVPQGDNSAEQFDFTRKR